MPTEITLNSTTTLFFQAMADNLSISNILLIIIVFLLVLDFVRRFLMPNRL